MLGTRVKGRDERWDDLVAAGARGRRTEPNRPRVTRRTSRLLSRQSVTKPSESPRRQWRSDSTRTIPTIRVRPERATLGLPVPHISGAEL